MFVEGRATAVLQDIKISDEAEYKCQVEDDSIPDNANDNFNVHVYSKYYNVKTKTYGIRIRGCCCCYPTPIL